MYQSVLQESQLVGGGGDLAVTPGLSAVRVPLTLELLGPTLPLLQLHFPTRNQGMAHPKPMTRTL